MNDEEQDDSAIRPRNRRGLAITVSAEIPEAPATDEAPVETVGADPEVDSAPPFDPDRPAGPPRRAEWTDRDGRRWIVLIPDGVTLNHARYGVPVGPPSLASLGWPIDVEVRLHNQLVDRGIFTLTDATTRPLELQAAIQRALRVDVQRVQAAFAGIGLDELPDPT